MKFWLVTTEYPPFFGGGIATYCVHTAAMMSEAGHSVTVIAEDKSLPERMRVGVEGGIRVVRFKSGDHSIFQQLGWNAALSYQISDLIVDLGRFERPDVIEFQDCSALAYWTLQRKLTGDRALRDLFVSVHAHTPGSFLEQFEQRPVHMFPNYWIGQMERFCFAAADLVTFPSKLMSDALSTVGYRFARETALVRNPYLIPDGFQKKRGEPKRELVQVGRIQLFKGVPRLLKTMRKLWADGLDIPLRIIGGDTTLAPRQRSMRAILEERYAPEIEKSLLRFEGLVATDKLGETVGHPLAIICPSLFDNFPYAVIESMASGQMVVTSRACGCSELMTHGRDAWLCDFDQEDSLRDVIDRIAALPKSERRDMSESARRTVEAHCGYKSVLAAKVGAIEAAQSRQKGKRPFPFAGDIATAAQKPVAMINGHVTDLLSVVVPYYNMGEWIDETIDSLANSAYAPMEVIIVDDGSTDPKSVERLCRLEQRNWPFDLRVVRKRNGGLASARNAGAQDARGEFLAILDSDDQVAYDYYQSAIDIMREYDNVHFVGCWVEHTDDQPDWVTWNPELPAFLFANQINTSGMVFRTSSFLAAGMNDTRFEYGLEDWESAISMVASGLRGVAIPRVLFRYRVRSDSMLRSLTHNAKLHLYQMIIEKHPQVFASYAVDLIGIMNCNGPWTAGANPSFPPPAGLVNEGAAASALAHLFPADVRSRLVDLAHSRVVRSAVGIMLGLGFDRAIRRLAMLKRRNRASLTATHGASS
jgi:glycosyltransferase involved in cell wall biosynthesis